MSQPVILGAADLPPVKELRNNRGDCVEIMPFGAIIRAWHVDAGEHGVINIVLGYPHSESYLRDRAYHGAIAGRYCNRIAHSRFSLSGQTYTLDNNEGEHHLHGGDHGFSRRLWSVEDCSDRKLSLRLFSAAGDQGYPGNLTVHLQYQLEDDGALCIDWQAESDADTVVSLTSHGYYNLAGGGDILDHYLRIPAEHYTPVDVNMIPTGALQAVAGSPFDLRSFARLGDIVASDNPEITTCGGLDHNFACGEPGEMRVRAQLLCSDTNLQLTASSTLPGLQCYTGNHLQANGVHGSCEGVCLEPQYYPDSPNQPAFPSPILRAGETMRHSIRYHPGVVDAQALLAGG